MGAPSQSSPGYFASFTSCKHMNCSCVTPKQVDSLERNIKTNKIAMMTKSTPPRSLELTTGDVGKAPPAVKKPKLMKPKGKAGPKVSFRMATFFI